MSVYGGHIVPINIYGFVEYINKKEDTIDFTKLLLDLYDFIKVVQDAVKNVFLARELAITPEMGFKDIKLSFNPVSMFARRVYYQNGYKSLDNGQVDCRLLEKIYNEHPILKQYLFEEYEPKCCT